MSEVENNPETRADQSTEHFPVEPFYHPVNKLARKIYDSLASAKLAMFLLVLLLICCVVGVTIYRKQAGSMIFNTLWFNAIMVLLVVNVACCFFGRIWGRRVTIVSFGMILFHLSFVAVFLGIVFNSLFYFRGTIRLTEGEVLPSNDPQSYDNVDKGRFFSFSRLKGETTLVKMHTGYKVSGEDKRAAYEVSVGEEGSKGQGIIYITHKLTHGGIDYFNDKEGYSLLVVLSDRLGKDMYGAYLPLQSIRLKEGGYLYSTGYKDGNTVKPDVIQYPQPPEKPLYALQVEYLPSKLQERGGEAKFLVYPLDDKGMPESRPLAEGKAAIGGPFAAGEYILSAREVRYWVGMSVLYEPGKPIVLASLWAGLAGMIITMFGRMMRRRVRPA